MRKSERREYLEERTTPLSAIYSIFIRHTDNMGSDVVSQGRCLFLYNFPSVRKKYTESKFDKPFM